MIVDHSLLKETQEVKMDMENIETDDSASGSSSTRSGPNQEMTLTNANFQIESTSDNQNYTVKDNFVYLGEQELGEPNNISFNVFSKNRLSIKKELGPELASGSRRDDNSDITEKIFNCDKCGLFFNDYLMLQHHSTSCVSLQIRNTPSNDSDVQRPRKLKKVVEKPFECSLCGSCFEKKSYLVLHMRVHTGEKPYKCSICSKQFTLIGNIKSHMSVHSNERPFECSVCHRKFARKDYRRLHMKTHTGERPFVCPVCNRAFGTRFNMERHLKSHHMKEK